MAKKRRSKSVIVTHTATGGTVQAFGRNGIPAPTPGYFDPETGRSFKHERIREDKGIGSASHVRITNPGASEQARAEKTASLGMGNVGQRGRSFD
jgi:hypothetical protein